MRKSPITGSLANDVLDCFALDDLPGIAAVLVDGEPTKKVSWR